MWYTVHNIQCLQGFSADYESVGLLDGGALCAALAGCSVLPGDRATGRGRRGNDPL